MYKYISGITDKNKHKMLSTNGMADHIHMLVGFNTNQSVAGFMQDVKADSSQWINSNKFARQGLSGNWVMVSSHILNLKYQRLFSTFKIKKNIIKR